MTNVWVVRADGGKYTEACVKGGYTGIGWDLEDLTEVRDYFDIRARYTESYPEDSSNSVIGQQAGQITRFLLEINAGDYVITPSIDTEWLHYGKVGENPSYSYFSGDDGCPYRHRRSVEWASKRLNRSDFSIPFQNTLRASLTVFAVWKGEEFLEKIGLADRKATAGGAGYDPYRAVLDQILELDDREFEILTGHLLTALGFEGSEVTGKSGDGGVDATGVLNASNLAQVKVFVQAKRYQLGATVTARTVKELRQSIPFGGQGAFITTADFQKKAADVALEAGFPRIGLINGSQLVDLLIEHWQDIPEEFRDLLGLKPGLVRA